MYWEHDRRTGVPAMPTLGSAVEMDQYVDVSSSWIYMPDTVPTFLRFYFCVVDSYLSFTCIDFGDVLVSGRRALQPLTLRRRPDSTIDIILPPMPAASLAGTSGDAAYARRTAQKDPRRRRYSRGRR